MYDAKSCNPLAKPFYRPIEAAIRWCGLIDEEMQILAQVGDALLPPASAFPMYPCLAANTQRIVHALENNELPSARDGRRVGPNEPVARARLTVLHTDLKAWMAQHYPDQKPTFLFDEIERATHQAINADSFRALQVERNNMALQLKEAAAWYDQHHDEVQRLEAEREQLRQENAALRARLEQSTTDASEPDPRHRTTLLRIIGALLDMAGMMDEAMAKTSAAHAINSQLKAMGQREMHPKNTIAPVIVAARHLANERID